MPKYRMATPEELGTEQGTVLASFHAELLRQGIGKETAARLAERAAGAACSNSDGNCSELVRMPWEAVVDPVLRRSPRG